MTIFQGSKFSGYLDREASGNKTVRNVFDKGDMAFLSGNIWDKIFRRIFVDYIFYIDSPSDKN